MTGCKYNDGCKYVGLFPYCSLKETKDLFSSSCEITYPRSSNILVTVFRTRNSRPTCYTTVQHSLVCKDNTSFTSTLPLPLPSCCDCVRAGEDDEENHLRRGCFFLSATWIDCTPAGTAPLRRVFLLLASAPVCTRTNPEADEHAE